MHAQALQAAGSRAAQVSSPAGRQPAVLWQLQLLLAARAVLDWAIGVVRPHVAVGAVSWAGHATSAMMGARPLGLGLLTCLLAGEWVPDPVARYAVAPLLLAWTMYF